MIDLCFVAPSKGNRFMTELLEAVASVATELGASTRFAFDEFPDPAAETAYVVIPHELFALIGVEQHPDPDQLWRTISFCVEHPGTPWFELSYEWARVTAAVLDINRSSLAELRRRGVQAEHFQIGYCPAWDRWGGDEARERPVDVLYMGSTDARRDAFLASYAPILSSRRSQLLVPPLAPKTGSRADFLMGSAKHDLLASANTLLNLHRERSSALEWVRVMEAIANGCVVVSEHSADPSPLVPAEHFVSGAPENLALLADYLLEAPDELAELRIRAYEFARKEVTMSAAVERLLLVAEDVARSAPPPHPRVPVRPPDLDGDPERGSPEAARDVEFAHVRAGLRHVVSQLTLLRRSVDDLRTRLESDAVDLAEVTRTRAYDRARPRVSVAIPLFNHAREVVEALSSVARSRYAEYEVVIVDDASADGSADAVRAFLEERPWFPGVLVRRRVNGGLGCARNTAARLARGEFLLMLDADNAVYSTALERLVAALDGHPEVAFAYPMLQMRSGDRSAGLMSALPWEPERLTEGNYIDALSLIRKHVLLGLGGYSEDERLSGWEDWHLWLRLAENGQQGLLVPQILAWYRKTRHSLISITGIDTTVALSLIADVAPGATASGARTTSA